MIHFEPVAAEDLDLLNLWIALDDHHHGQSSEFWLTGTAGSLLAFRLADNEDTLLYARCDEPADGVVRLHIQFLPTEVVSKRKLIAGMLKAIPVLFDYLKTVASVVVFESVSPALISFFERQTFKSVGKDDYLLTFGEPVVINCGKFDGVEQEQ
jgi:hypothetical protein